MTLFHTKHETWETSARRDPAQRLNERIANLLDAARLATVCEDAWFVKAVSIGQYFMTGPFGIDSNSSFGVGSRMISRMCIFRHKLIVIKKNTTCTEQLMAWVAWVWARRNNDTPQPRGQPDSQSFPH